MASHGSGEECMRSGGWCVSGVPPSSIARSITRVVSGDTPRSRCTSSAHALESPSVRRQSTARSSNEIPGCPSHPLTWPDACRGGCIAVLPL
eukprot:scaffold263532_cov39-Tisochrysis_lutea.AAC.1